MIIWFSGGLGNQMFQYALYLAAMHRGFQVEADLSYYKSKKIHNGYELKEIFNIDLNVTTIEFNAVEKRDLLAKVLRKIGVKNYGVNKNVILEDKSNYIQDLFSENNSQKYLMGYWQSEKYFDFIKREISNAFTFPKLDRKNAVISQEMQNCNSVSLHIRRGDYIAIPIYQKLWSTNYYFNAINYFINEYKDVVFYVFSDDIIWCKNNMNLPKNTKFIEKRLKIIIN